jgi:hypothetical protein
VDIRRVTSSDTEAVLAAVHLFGSAPLREATERFVASSTHHLLIASVDGEPAGMVTGVETTHPD